MDNAALGHVFIGGATSTFLYDYVLMTLIPSGSPTKHRNKARREKCTRSVDLWRPNAPRGARGIIITVLFLIL